MELQGSLQMTQPGSALVTQQGGVLDSYMLLVFGIMILAGLLGGVANYFLGERNVESTWKDLAKYAVLGVVAALTVPLFLNMISSNLLDMARTRPINLFVFAGFCLIFVLFSRRFVENVVNRLLQQLGQIRGEVDRIKEGNQLAETMADLAVDEQPLQKADAAKGGISYGDIEIMRAISDGGFVYGNLSGIAVETALPKDLVNARLSLLKGMNLVEAKINDKSVLHWSLSAKGRQLLDEILTSQDEKYVRSGQA